MAKIPQNPSSEVSQRFSVRDNTFFQEKKSNPKDRIQVEVGDSKQPDNFYPQAKIIRWDNEVNASFRLVDNEPGQPTVATEGKVIKYKRPKWEFHAYDLDPANELEDGGLEVELLLKEKPDTNVFEFTIQTKGLNFSYQPALTQEEIDGGAERLDEVVGSYAVYHATKGGVNRMIPIPEGKYTPQEIADGKRDGWIKDEEINTAPKLKPSVIVKTGRLLELEQDYKVGKAFHIYRPKITDANGSETWGELNVDEQNGLLTVTIDQTWLDNAVYPVLVDPTFGYTSKGSTAYYFPFSGASNDTIYLGKFTLPENGDVFKLTPWYGTNNGGHNGGATRAVIYDDSSNPNNLQGEGDEVSVPDASGDVQQDLTFGTYVSLSSGDYWMGVFSLNRSVVYGDSSGGSNAWGADSTYPGAVDPFPTPLGTGSIKYSIYATYVTSTITSLGTNNDKASTDPWTAFSSVSVSAGDTLIMVVSNREPVTWGTTSSTSYAYFGSSGNPFTPDVTNTSDTLNQCAIFSRYFTGADTQNIVIDFDNTTVPTAKAATLYKVTGLQSSSLDKTNSAISSSATSITTGASGTLSQTDEIIVMASAVNDEIDDAHGTWSPITSYEQFAATNDGGDSSNIQAHSVVGAVSSTATITGTDGTHDSCRHVGLIATYKVAAAGGGGGTTPGIIMKANKFMGL